jgi:hypothetical protein
MTLEEIEKYLNPACVRIIGLKMPYVTCGDADKLDDLLGLDYWSCHRTPMPEEIKQLYIKLAGPHGKTVLKAWRILKGLEP